jgi:uncharacterized membrane protein YbhN (UPF0104 family)
MPAGTVNFSNTTPAAPGGSQNVSWQNDGGSSTVNISAYLPFPTEEVVTFSGTSGTLAHAPTFIYGLFRNGVRQQTHDNTRADYFSISGAAITLATAAGGMDEFIAVYSHS